MAPRAKRELRKTCGLLLAALITVAAPPDPSRADEVLQIAGSTTLQPLAERLSRGYRKGQPDAVLRVTGGGSARGLAALIAGEVEIAASSRFISPEELALARQRGVYPVPFRVAYDCIIPVVHTGNRLRGLTLQQLRDIYSGRLDNWRQLGGADLPIRLVSRESDSGTRATWQNLVMGAASESRELLEQASNLEVVRAVAREPGAIGYIGLGYLSASIRPLTVDGVMGSLRSAREGSYPLSRSLYFFTDGWPDGRSLEFIDFALDPDGGQRSVVKSGFVPLYSHERH